MNDPDDFTPDRIPTYEEWCITLNRCEQKLAVSQAEVARLQAILESLPSAQNNPPEEMLRPS